MNVADHSTNGSELGLRPFSCKPFYWIASPWKVLLDVGTGVLRQRSLYYVFSSDMSLSLSRILIEYNRFHIKPISRQHVSI